MALLFLTLGFSLTGYLLPWDQKGYWATKVATNIAGGAPVLGPFMQKLVVGGTEYGNQTLTRFYGLHVGVLPTLLVLCLAAHIALFRKHGITAPRNAKKEGRFWPEQVFMDTVASVAVLGVLVFVVIAEGGANLDAPADPSSANYPARPEWYFLSLFQMLKYFRGENEIVGAIVIPTAIMVVLLLLPLLDRVLPGRIAHFLACAFVFALVGGAGYLTVEAWREDGANQKFIADRREADAARKRALELAGDEKVGIPPDGAAYVLLRDPLYHGRAVLGRKCLGCHYYDGKGVGEQSAADLKGFGSRAWVRGLLENPQSPAYFGKVPQCDGMAEWKKNSKLSPEQLDDVADFVATFAEIPAGTTPQEWLEDPKVAEHPGLEPFQADCTQCHLIEGLGEERGGPAQRAQPLRLGFAAVDRPDDPQAGRLRHVRLPRQEGPDAFIRRPVDRERHGDAHPIPPQRLSRRHLPLGGPAQDRGGQGGRPLRARSGTSRLARASAYETRAAGATRVPRFRFERASGFSKNGQPGSLSGPEAGGVVSAVPVSKPLRHPGFPIGGGRGKGSKTADFPGIFLELATRHG